VNIRHGVFERYSLFFILTAGFVLRLFYLDSPSLWGDEIMTAGRIDHSVSLLRSILPKILSTSESRSGVGSFFGPTKLITPGAPETTCKV